MPNKDELRNIVIKVFEEEALVIGGIAATNKVSDDVLWSITRNLDAILRKTLKRLRLDSPPTKAPSIRPKPLPHPAIEELLGRITQHRAAIATTCNKGRAI